MDKKDIIFKFFHNFAENKGYNSENIMYLFEKINSLRNHAEYLEFNYGENSLSGGRFEIRLISMNPYSEFEKRKDQFYHFLDSFYGVQTNCEIDYTLEELLQSCKERGIEYLGECVLDDDRKKVLYSKAVHFDSSNPIDVVVEHRL